MNAYSCSCERGKGRIDGMWGDDNDGNFVSYSHTQELWHAKNFN